MIKNICEYCECEIINPKNSNFCNSHCQRSYKTISPCCTCGSKKKRNFDEYFCSQKCKDKENWSMFRHNLELILGITGVGPYNGNELIELNYKVRDKTSPELLEYTINFEKELP